jgi:hypothetical protein
MQVLGSRPGRPSALLGPARLESCASTLPNAVDSGGAESRDSGRDLDEEAEEEVGLASNPAMVTSPPRSASRWSR